MSCVCLEHGIPLCHCCLKVERPSGVTWIVLQRKGIPANWQRKETFSALQMIKETEKYGRIISFGKEESQLPSSQLPSLDSKELLHGSSTETVNSSCREVWTEYDKMNREAFRKIAENKVYTSKTILDLLRFVAPKTMQRTKTHFSHGIADNLDDPKYDHYKYWSIPLETKLPDAPDMGIYCLYGVGFPTERSYVYKLSPNDKCKSIRFRIDTSADADQNSCLKGGVYFVDGDESVPVLRERASSKCRLHVC